jgi:hypothetical protein
MIMETWRVIAVIGAVVFIFSAMLPLISIQFIGTFSVSLLDLYSTIGRGGTTSTPEIPEMPSELTQPFERIGIGLLMTVILFPITAIIGFISAATSRKLALAAGILGIICWLGSIWAISELKSLLAQQLFGQIAAGMIQFGTGIFVGILGALIMLASYFIRPSQTKAVTKAPQPPPPPSPPHP